MKESDPFWYEKPQIIISLKRLTEFFPNPNLSLYEKLNAIVRLALYISLILLILFGQYIFVYIFIFILVLTYLIYKSNVDKNEKNIEKYNNFILSQNYGTEQKLDKNKLKNMIDITEKDINDNSCTLPSVNNPFMNINTITDKRDKPKACESYNDNNIKKKIENNFNFNLYRDVSDLYNKNNSQREYYTAPSTTIPNDQMSFAKWCYLSPPTCKEDTIRCVPYTTQPPIPEVELGSLQLKNN